MALISKDNFTRLEKTRHSIRSHATATFSVFSEEGKKFFQIDTYGSVGRDNPGKASQTIQFDKSMAEELIKRLRQEFSI